MNETERENTAFGKVTKEEKEARVAQDVTEDFLRRREARRSLESGWLLNINFFNGNQYCDVAPSGEIVEEDARFYWQSRRAFNHIAPTIDSRIAKLEKLKPELCVRAFSDEEGDVYAAQLATGVLRYVQARIGLAETISKAIGWSEICGSAFYKIVWAEDGGRQVAVTEDGIPVYEGEAQVIAVSPFEIFPDRLDAEDIDGVASLIHAQTVTARYISEKFGVAVEGKTIATAAYSEPAASRPNVYADKNRTNVEDGVLLLERYTKPSGEYPDGRVEIVADGKLLYEGVLPYLNKEKGERGFPFVKQDCLRLPGAFFGGSIVDRLIPVQRAYNAVRNRKHEFLNRLSLGVLTVEDGSIDTEELETEGLLPGKILVYRQGGKAPEMLDCGDVPSAFKDEEEWLEKEFALISGVSDLSQNSTPSHVTSATGLQLLLTQDETRLSATIGSMQQAIKEVGRHILRLYRQFAGTARLMTMTGENKKTQVHYFNASNLAVNDLQFESQDATTPEEKRATLLKLYEAGLLTDKEGQISPENKNRILEAFGFGSYENAKDISALHRSKAIEENLDLRQGEVSPDDYDEHDTHILEHIRFLLSAEFKNSAKRELWKRNFLAHIEAHKQYKKNQ